MLLFQQRQLAQDRVKNLLFFFAIVLFLLCYKFVMLFILESVKSEHTIFPKNHWWGQIVDTGGPFWSTGGPLVDHLAH